MKLLHFLKACRQDLWAKKVKMARHVDDRCDLELLLRAEQFDEYQMRQASEVFNCDYVVSFIGEGGSRCRLIDVYEVRGVATDGKETPYSAGYLYPSIRRPTYRYDLARVEGFAMLRD